MTDVLITASDLAELIKKESCVIIDTRNPDAYAAGHLPGAVHMGKGVIERDIETKVPDPATPAERTYTEMRHIQAGKIGRAHV